jgi:hypothetical protein
MAQRSDQELVSWEIIGAELGVTGEGARKIYLHALMKIREYLKENPGRREAAHNLLVDCEPRSYGDSIDMDIERDGC